jgi:hypothetical protein
MEGSRYRILDMGTPEGRAECERHDAEKAEQVKRGQQLYAKIKRSSKYFGQGEKNALFEVFVEAGSSSEYLVQGGPGGQYRLADVNLYIVEDGREVRIS